MEGKKSRKWKDYPNTWNQMTIKMMLIKSSNNCIFKELKIIKIMSKLREKAEKKYTKKSSKKVDCLNSKDKNNKKKMSI